MALDRLAGAVGEYQPRPDELLDGTAAADAWERFIGGLRRLELRHDELTVAVQGANYDLWSPVGGINAKEYAPRPSTEDEINALGGGEGAYETLLPGLF